MRSPLRVLRQKETTPPTAHVLRNNKIHRGPCRLTTDFGVHTPARKTTSTGGVGNSKCIYELFLLFFIDSLVVFRASSVIILLNAIRQSPSPPRPYFIFINSGRIFGTTAYVHYGGIYLPANE